MTALVEGHLVRPCSPAATPQSVRGPLHPASASPRNAPRGASAPGLRRSDLTEGWQDVPCLLGFRPVAGEVLMSSHLVFNGVDVVKQRLEAYWSKKLPRLEKLLAPYPRISARSGSTVSHHRNDPQHRVLRGTGRRQAADRDARRRGDGRRSAGCPGPDRRQARRGDQTAQGQGPARLCLQTEEPQPGRSQRGRAPIARARRGRQSR